MTAVKMMICILFLSFLSRRALASELSVAPFYGYGQGNFYGQTQIPTYRGQLYGIILEFKQTWKTFSLGFYGEYATRTFDNTGNSSAQKESLAIQDLTAGFKFYSEDMYFKLGYGLNHTIDKSSGTTNKEIDLRSNMFQAGFGTSWEMSPYFRFFVEAQVNYSKYQPEFGGLTKATELVNYNGLLGVIILIPSEAKQVVGPRSRR